ncbi:hypothetical protein Z517_10113 [Fonsecaea pedrosoi CBS 271.37]|uniref:Uncharacterized protein n=1 Tax=Fonsecaea pedrosoi CBS 271.37 TaxID=1442368 RepID=A0A0D2ELV6_9EURO|nr:uncharacterized protein Z517_10113 [Fonsecaea pedrosoi CBS 271.37]KIW75372.1 hypothetical protein Z517_10113 [Fonsecaea pedrosoi CBS 271.37]
MKARFGDDDLSQSWRKKLSDLALLFDYHPCHSTVPSGTSPVKAFMKSFLGNALVQMSTYAGFTTAQLSLNGDFAYCEARMFTFYDLSMMPIRLSVPAPSNRSLERNSDWLVGQLMRQTSMKPRSARYAR